MELEIANYIKEARRHGLQDQEIKQNLLDVGWDPGQVEDSFGYVKVSDTAAARFVLPGAAAGQTPASSLQASPQPGPVQPVAAAAHPEIFPKTGSKPPNFSPGQNTGLPVMSFNLPTAGTNVSPSASETSLADENFNQPKTVKKPALMILGGVIALAVLAVGGYFAYGYFVPPTAQKIWNGYLAGKPGATGKSSFNFSYSDPGLPDSTGGKLQPFSFSLSGDSYGDLSHPSSTVFSSQFTAGYKAMGQSGNLDFKAEFLGNILYLDLSSIPGLNALAGQPVNWIKLDINGLRKLASSTPAYGRQLAAGISQEQQNRAKIQNDLANVIKNKRIITAGKILGSETLNGAATYHLQNQIDKQAIKDMVAIVIDDSPPASMLASASPQSLVQIKNTVNQVIDKVQIATFETWIGKSDHRLYKMSLDAKFPGFVSWYNDSANPLARAQAKSRDAKRVADMRQMSSALELFYNDHNGYPPGQNGIPIGVTPAYMGLVPAAPTPSDGDCSDYYNTYWYIPTGAPRTTNGLVVYPSYTYTFCLGNDTGGYKTGIGKMTASGIQDNILCGDKPENCHKQADTRQPAPAPQQLADLSIQTTYYDFGKTENIAAPADSLDLVRWLQDKMGTGTPATLPPNTY